MKSAVVNAQTNIVTNIIVANPDTDACPYSGHFLVAATGDVKVGFQWDGSAFLDPNPEPQPTLGEIKEKKLNLLSSTRWNKETGGTTFNGLQLSTDPVSQTKYVGAVVGMQLDPSATIKWKMADGTFVVLDANAVTSVAIAVRNHIQACFDNEAIIRAAIAAASSKAEVDAIDINIGWPT